MKAATNTPTSINSTTDTPSWLNFAAWLGATLALMVTVAIVIIVLNNSSHHSIEFQISSFSVSPFIVYSSSVTANWNITLLARNNYKDKSIYYDSMQVSVFYSKEFLSMAVIVVNDTGLHLGPKSETSLNASLVASSVSVKDSAGTAMAKDLKDVGIVAFNVAVQGVVRVGGTHSERRLLRVDCDYVNAEVLKKGTDGALFGGLSKCYVEDDN